MIGKSDYSGDIDDFLLNLIVFIFVFINFTHEEFTLITFLSTIYLFVFESFICSFNLLINKFVKDNKKDSEQ